MKLSQDICLDDAAFRTASEDMGTLKERTQNLKEKLEQMYRDLTTALDTPAGHALEITAESVLIQPIDNLLLVIDHTSQTLAMIAGSGYYKNVFDSYEQLNQSIK